MAKCKDLSEFDEGQTVMSRRLGQSVSKTAALVGCFPVCSVQYLSKVVQGQHILNPHRHKATLWTLRPTASTSDAKASKSDAKGFLALLRQKARRKGYPQRLMWTPSDATSTAAICDDVGCECVDKEGPVVNR
ncbi:hypothetical protein C0J50_23262 [Silurus asotus]|uniref:Uncharacterized protein n=1 Tax=Silurus asotus TaxID=30991 RepID=A0AAD5FIL6_SILAS|nr:hypothetical protein C0J50_23262 [Silurus asotus]